MGRLHNCILTSTRIRTKGKGEGGEEIHRRLSGSRVCLRGEEGREEEEEEEEEKEEEKEEEEE